MIPVQNMLSFRAHVELKFAHCVAAIGEKRDLLVQLHPLGLKHLIEPTFGLLIQRLHEPKALARGEIVFLITSEGQGTLPHDNLEVMLLGVPVPHIAPVDAHRDRPIRDGEGAPIAGAPRDKTPLFVAQCCFTTFSDFQGIVAHGLHVERDIEGQKIFEGIHRHAV